MASVAHPSTLSTTAKRTSQTTSATLEDVLIDMYVPVQVNEHVSDHYSRAHRKERHLGDCQTDTTWILEHFLSICPLGLVARHWAVVNRVRAARYAPSVQQP